MTWNFIRLELARSEEFPRGSPSRVYLLRLPLTAEGLIDEAELNSRPGLATVHRFWPNEADLSGHVIKTSAGWGFLYEIAEDKDEICFQFEPRALRLGECLTLTARDGERWPFKISSLEPVH